MSNPILPPLKPVPIKDRVSVLFMEKGHLDVLDRAFVIVDKPGVRTHIPVGGVACLMPEPGSRVSYAAVALAIGFIHTGKPQSFVYDIADIFKFETVVPVTFRIKESIGDAGYRG